MIITLKRTPGTTAWQFYSISLIYLILTLSFPFLLHCYNFLASLFSQLMIQLFISLRKEQPPEEDFHMFSPESLSNHLVPTSSALFSSHYEKVIFPPTRALPPSFWHWVWSPSSSVSSSLWVLWVSLPAFESSIQSLLYHPLTTQTFISPYHHHSQLPPIPIPLTINTAKELYTLTASIFSPPMGI